MTSKANSGLSPMGRQKIKSTLRTMFISARLNHGKYECWRQDGSIANLLDSPQSTSRAQHALSIPRLHPVYLPFKTQHRLLVHVQSLLEECCLEFGNTWVPDLMEARKWNEAESIELTEWTKRFLKYARSLPPSAIQSVPGKSIAEVLFGTSALRHSAVHRLPTSAAGISKMLSAASTFAEALNDSKRAEKVAEIKVQLEATIEGIVQHQNLLERKLTDQFEDIARRRAELDELERSSIEEMMATDKKQRTEVGSAFESFLVGYQQISNPCACSHTPSFDGAKADFKAEENMESSWIGMFLYAFCSYFKSHPLLYLFLTLPLEHELKTPDGMNEPQAYDQSSLGEEKINQSEWLEKDDRPPCHDNSCDSIERGPEVSELTVSTLTSEGQKNNGDKAAASGRGFSAAEEAPLVDEAPASEAASPAPVHVTAHGMGWKWPRKGVWNFGTTIDVPADAHNAAEEAIPAEEPCFAAPEGTFPRDEPYIIGPEEEGAISKEHPMEREKAAPETTLEGSQPELNNEGFNDVELHPLNQHCHISHHSGDSYESRTEPDAASIHGDPVEDAIPALIAVRHKIGLLPPSPSAPSSAVTSILEAAAPEAPMEDSHTITLKILNGSKIIRSVVFIRACTRTAILNEARAYCVKRAQDDESFGRLLAKGWDLVLVSLKMYGYDMDLSTYQVEDLSSLVRTVEKTDIPRFTLRISGI